MTNSISTTLVEVTKKYSWHSYDSQCQSQPHDSLTSFYVKLLWQRHWQVMMLWFMSRCHNKDILNNAIFAFNMSLLSKDT